MNIQTNKKIILGIFVIGGLAIFIAAIFILGSKRNLFSSQSRLNAYFENVAGLRTGSTVNFSGISVGSVESIDIISSDKIKVSFTVKNEVLPFIKTDSKTMIASEGLVGSKILEISPGSQNAPSVSDGQYIESVKPITPDDIIKNLNEAGKNASGLTKELDDVVAKVNRGEGTIGQLINNDSLYYAVYKTMNSFSEYSTQINRIVSVITGAVQNLSGDVESITKEMDITLKNLTDITSKLNSSQSFLGTLLTDTSFANNLKKTIESASITAKNLEDGSRSFNQNMEALKHNFFFKGYFEDIGYWDKEDYELELEKKKQELKILEDKINQQKKSNKK